MDEDERLAEKPAHISEENWLKFQKLKERRIDVCKHLPEQNGGKRRRRVDDGYSHSSQSKKKSRCEILKNNREAWDELCSNIDAYVCRAPDSIAKPNPKSKLEQQLDVALNEQNFTKAETLSDQISQQELAVKIVGAIEMKKYNEQKDIKEKWKKCTKRKKLLWGFEQKEKWESKGNM